MNRNNKANLMAVVLIALVAGTIQSCVKSREGRTNFDDLQPTVAIREGGLATFGSQALTFPAADSIDTVYFRINYAAKEVAPADIIITLEYDEAALSSFNSSSVDQYEKFPDSVYSFTTKTITIKAGQQFSDPIPLIVYPYKVDATKNYLFPISIANGGGTLVSGNFGTVYYHFIGNPIAGGYLWNWHRWNASDSTSVSLNGLSFDGEPTVFAPVDPTTIEVPTGYYTQPRYVLTFDNTDGIISNFDLSFNQDDLDYMATGGVTVAEGPNILVADPATGHYKFQWVASASGNPRYLTDEFYLP